MKKRIFIFLLTFLVLLGNLNITFAQKERMGINNYMLHTRIVPDSNFVPDPSVDIYKMFDINKGLSKNQVSNMILGSRASFDYVIDEINEHTSDVSMEGTVFITNKAYDFRAEGKVDIITIDGKSLINGPITGFMIIDNAKVDLTIHFQKYKHSDNILITMSLFDSERNINAFLSFGERFVSEQFKERIISRIENTEWEADIANSDGISIASTGNFEFIDQTSTSGVYVALARNVPPTSKAFRLRLNSYPNTIKSMLNASHVEVHSTMGQMEGFNGTFWLTATHPTTQSSDIVLNQVLVDVFEKAGIPVSLLSYILIPYTTRGDISLTGIGNAVNRSITVNTRGIGNRLDIHQHGFPFVFVISCDYSVAHGKFRGSVGYRYWDQWDMMYYYTAQTAYKNFNTTIY